MIGYVVRPDEPGESHVIISSEVTILAYRKRIFLNPISEGAPAFIQAVADSSDDVQTAVTKATELEPLREALIVNTKSISDTCELLQKQIVLLSKQYL